MLRVYTDSRSHKVRELLTSAEADHHFALLSAQVLEMDWLELRREGHRRASLRPDSWRWLAP